MAECIFCGNKTDFEIAKGKSICVPCYIKLKKIEFEHAKEITQATIGEEALQRMRERFASLEKNR